MLLLLSMVLVVFLLCMCLFVQLQCAQMYISICNLSRCRFRCKVFECRVGRDIDGTALSSTKTGNVVMGEWFEEPESNENRLSIVYTSVDDTICEKLYAMLERLWIIDSTDAVSKRTAEQEMVEQHHLNTHYRDETGRFVAQIPLDLKCAILVALNT